MRRLLIGLFAILLASCAGTKPPNVCKNKEYAETMKDKAAADFQAENYYTALDDILAAKKCIPKDPEVYYWLGRIYYARAEKGKARENFRQAVTLNPAYPEAHEFLGIMSLEEGRYEDAIADFQVAANDDQFRMAYESWNNIGWAYMQQGRFAEAEKAFSRSLALNPRFCVAHSNLGEMRAKQKNYAAAQNEYAKAIEQCPSYARVHRLLGIEYSRQGKVSQACREFQLSLKNSVPESEDAKAAKGYLQVLNCKTGAGQ